MAALIAKPGDAITFYAKFISQSAGLGVSGLTVKVSVNRGATNIISVASSTNATEVDATNHPGLYSYTLAGGSTGTEGQYVAQFTTTDNSVSAQSAVSACEVSSRFGNLDNLDAAISAVQSRLPASLVSGRIDASVGEMQSNVVTTASINDGAFTVAKFASGFFQAIWDVLTSALTTAGSIGKLLVDNINATISSRLASASYTAPDNSTISTINSKIGTPVFSVSADIAGVQADTDNIQTRLPAALVSGRMDSNVQAMADDVITAAAIAANAIGASELAADAIAEIQSGLATAAAIAALNNLSAAQVNAEMLDVLTVDTFTQLAAPPGASATLKNMLIWAYMIARDKIIQDETEQTLRNLGDTADVATAPVTVTSSGATRGEWV